MFMLFTGRNGMHWFDDSDTDLGHKSIATIWRSVKPPADVILLQLNLVKTKSSQCPRM